MELRAARRSERDEVLDLLALWYGDRDFFARYNHHDPGFRDELCLVARDGGRIAAIVQIFERAINLRGARVPMGGIGSVYTGESNRGRGLASALMGLAAATMEREGFELSLLFAERLDFYARFGWRPVTRQFTAIADAHAIRVGDGFTPARFEETRDLGSVAALHRTYSGRFDAVALRDPAGWRGNLRYAGNPGEYFVVCRRPETGALAAYARAIMFHGFPMVMEYGYAPDAADAMVTLLGHLGKAAAGVGSSPAPAEADGAAILRNPAAAAGTSLLVSHTAHDPALEDRLRAAGAFLMHHPDNFFMWRVIAPDRLAARLNVAPETVEEDLFALLEAPNALYWTADRF